MATTTLTLNAGADLARTIWGGVARFGTHALNVLVLIGMSSGIGQKVEALNALTDEELAAQGTTRAAEIQRIFGPYTL